MSYGIYFLLSLLFTIIVEVPIVFLLLKYPLNIKRPAKEIVGWSLFANFFSLPYLWFVFPQFTSSDYYVYIGETLVVIIEALIYRAVLKMNFKKVFIISLVANLASYLVGFLIN